MRLLLYTALSDLFFKYTFKTLQPIGHYIYHQINIQQIYDLPAQLYLCALCGSERKLLLFPYTALNDWSL